MVASSPVTCTAPIHQWAPQKGKTGWYCTECGTIIHHPPPEHEIIPGARNPRSPWRGAGKLTAAQWMSRVVHCIERDGCVCFYCEHDLFDPRVGYWPLGEWWPTLDHLLPRARGGTNAKSNLVLSCKACNVKKGDHVYLLAERLRITRRERDELRANEAGARTHIERLEWELFDAGIGDIPGRADVRSAKRTKLTRPFLAVRDDALFGEVGQRVYANVKAENLGNRAGRVGAIVKRFNATRRPRRNVEHVGVRSRNHPDSSWRF